MKEGGNALRDGAGIMLARKYCVATAKVVGRDVGGADAPTICVGRAVGAADLEGILEGTTSCEGIGGETEKAGFVGTTGEGSIGSR